MPSNTANINRPLTTAPQLNGAPKRRRAICAAVVICALLVLVSAPEGDAARVQAHAARTIALRESGTLRLTSKRGFTLNEQGSASGTIRGTIYIHLHLVSGRSVTAEVNIYPRGGSLSGSGVASYGVNGATASFSGTLSITRGTGSYAHARSSRLRFTGTIRRRDDAVSVQLQGTLTT